MKLGFVGLGTMRVPMAGNLIEAGHELAVRNRTGGRDGALAEPGAPLADAARGAQDVVLRVSDTGAIREGLFGEEASSKGRRRETLAPLGRRIRCRMPSRRSRRGR